MTGTWREWALNASVKPLRHNPLARIWIFQLKISPLHHRQAKPFDTAFKMLTKRGLHATLR